MTHHANWVVYIVFSVVILALLLYDLGIFKRKKKANEDARLIQASIIKTFIWIAFGLLFSSYIYLERGKASMLEYITAFIMEWSLSVDNVFVFILLFSNFKLSKQSIEKTLLIGVLLAIVLRILFIYAGISLISKFEWLFYVFAIFLIYTGISISLSKEENKEFKESKTSHLLAKLLRTKPTTKYRFFIKIDGRWYTTTVLLVVVLIAFTDITFALDSIPAVLSISQDTLIVYTSNIFAVLGLRSLYFALQGAKDKFRYLHKGIGIVLLFIGAKIFVGEFWGIHINILTSLGVIGLAFAGSIFMSILFPPTPQQKKQ